MLHERRQYQEDAHDAIISAWQSFDKVIMVLPTGAGKTCVFSKIIETETRNGNRCLVLAHRDELITQAADKLRRVTGIESAREQAGETALGSFWPCTVGSVQTLMRQSRLNRFSPDYYQRIIVDECHHALSRSYQLILKHFSSAKVLGVTATPDRGDMRNLGEYFENIAFEYSLTQAISEGYLAPIKAMTIPLKIELGNVRVTAGDFNDADLGSALDPYLPEIAKAVSERARDRKTVIFLPLIATSERMTAHLKSYGIDARHVCGVSPDRAEVLAWFNKANPGSALCNSMLLTEGWDEPSADAISVLRATKVRSLYAQMVGRGTRIHPGKKDLLILDFLWHTTNHQLCKPACLIASDETECEAAGNAIDAAGGRAVDIGEAIEDGRRNARLEREAKLARELHEKRNRQARVIDPLEFAMSIHSDAIESYEPTFRWHKDKPSPRQLEILAQRGFSASDIRDKGHASVLLEAIISRSQDGMCSPKQIHTLATLGVQDAGTLTFDQAQRRIAELIGTKPKPGVNLNW